jgi:hypothetical protein
LRLAAIQGVEGKQDLADLAPQDGFIPAELAGSRAAAQSGLTTRFDKTNPILLTVIYSDRSPTSAELCVDRADGLRAAQ